MKPYINFLIILTFIFINANGLAQGDQKECFYCGLKNHSPRDCPSRHLTLEAGGLTEVGYIPFKKLETMDDYEELVELAEEIIAGTVPDNDILKKILSGRISSSSATLHTIQRWSRS